MKKTLIFLAVLLLSAVTAFAFNFEPITQDFTSSGPDTIRNFTLHNDRDENVAVRIQVFSRGMDQNGEEELVPADKLFLVYPSQIVLRPHTNQTLKVQWRGPSVVDVEQSYRILVEQMAVNFAEDLWRGSNIRIMFRYLGSLYVVPPQADHEVVLESYKPASNDKGAKGLELVFHNKGKSHVILGDISITMKGEDLSEEPLILSPEDLAEINNQNLLAQNRRRFFLPLPDKYARDSTRISFNFDPIR